MEKKKIHVLPNTHWDREWYMPLEKYRIRLVRMMDRLLDLMEREEDYIFVTDGQYMFIEDYLAVRPENRDRIAALTAAGRLQVGPWYTQPLETLTTGEAMVRNLQLGIRESRALGGVMRFAYMVDEFGHASQTPQILRGFGIGDMLAWRGMDPALPHVFTWRAPDGSEVTMHRSIAGYGEATALPAAMEDYGLPYEGMELRRPGLASVMRNIRAIKEREPHSEVQFWLNGIDHSWAQEDLSDRLAQIRENWPEYDARISDPASYAADMARLLAEEGAEVPSFTGELMYPDNLLVSTHSCRADHKQMHYRAEHLIENYAEPASALAWLLGGEDAAWIADRAWKYILENHAHDSLGCCSVDEVYLQCMARYGSSISLSEQLLEDALAHMTAVDGDASAVYIYYPNSTSAGGVAQVVLDIPEAKDPGAFALEDEAGKRVPMELLRREKVMSTRYNPRRGHPARVPCSRYTLAVALPENEGIALRKLHMVPVKAFGSTRRAPEHGVLENAFLRAEIAGNGTVSLLDKVRGVRYDDLLLLEDGGENGTFYVHTKPLEDFTVTNRGAAAHITCLADNALMTRYRVEYTLDIPAGITSDAQARRQEKRPMDVVLEFTLFPDRPRLDVRLTVENRSDDHRLRLLFPTGMVMSRSGQPFDTVERPAVLFAGGAARAEGGESYDPALDAASGVAAAELECHPMQDFCGAFADDRGLAVAAPGVYEYELTPRGDLALTLFRAVDCIDRFEEHRQTGFDTHQAQLHTALTYDLAIFAHGEDLPAAEIADFVRPPVVRFFREREDALRENVPAPAQRNLTGEALVAVEGEGVTVTMVRQAADGGLIVRLLNTGKEGRTAVLRLSPAMGAFGAVIRTDLEENPLEKVGRGSTCTLDIPGKGLVTLHFDR